MHTHFNLTKLDVHIFQYTHNLAVCSQEIQLNNIYARRNPHTGSTLHFI